MGTSSTRQHLSALLIVVLGAVALTLAGLDDWGPYLQLLAGTGLLIAGALAAPETFGLREPAPREAPARDRAS